MSTLSMPRPRPSARPRDAYEALAGSYDLLTQSYPHGLWLGQLEALAIEHGLAGNRLLDLACGTGKSFLPMLERGYRVTACDISPSMLALARRKAPAVALHEGDLRELPRFGDFDLVTALDDPLNYLLTEHELEAALRGIARNLARDGRAIFDLNTLAQYRGQFSRDAAVDGSSSFVVWRGCERNRRTPAGGLVEATVEVFTAGGDGAWQRSSSVHRQRHWPRAVVRRLAHRSGLRILAVRGQRQGAAFDPSLDELVHIKAIYLVAKERST